MGYIFSDRASRRVGLLKLNKYKYFISTFNTETPLKPRNCNSIIYKQIKEKPSYDFFRFKIGCFFSAG